MSKFTYKIAGMHCASCEVRTEQALKKVQGVEKVDVTHHNGKAVITADTKPNLQELQKAMKDTGYSIESGDLAKALNDPPDYFEIAGIFVIVLVLYYIAKTLGIIPDTYSVSAGMSLWLVFTVGLVAAFSSCIAVTGGLLLAVSARFSERHPEFSGWRKFKPQAYFNAGRLFFYGTLGGAVGALGSILTPSARLNGIILLIAGVAMMLLGFQLLHLFPKAQALMPKMPKALAHKIHALQNHDHPAASFVLGGSTFFLPCGFTQAFQLYVLSQGDWKLGAITMFVFALGTLPALIFIGAISSFATGNFRHYFLKTAGVVVLIIGLFNAKNGLVLTGVYAAATNWATEVSDEITSNVEIVDGVQIARMKITYLDYYPSQFKVKKDMPVKWIIDGGEAVGCGRVLVAPKIGLSELLPTEGEKIIEFTPNKTGTIEFNCSMGMMTPGAKFIVTD